MRHKNANTLTELLVAGLASGAHGTFVEFFQVERHTGAAKGVVGIRLAPAVVSSSGMSESLGSVTYERDNRSYLQDPQMPGMQPEREFGESTGNAIDGEVKRIVKGALERTVGMILGHDLGLVSET